MSQGGNKGIMKEELDQVEKEGIKLLPEKDPSSLTVSFLFPEAVF